MSLTNLSNSKILSLLHDLFTGVPRATADVFLQDQHTPVVNWILHQDLETVTLAAPAVIDSRTVTLAAGHSAAAGQVLNLLEGDRYFQAIVLNVAVNDLTLDRPFDYAFAVVADATLGNPSLSVNGSITPRWMTPHLEGLQEV